MDEEIKKNIDETWKTKAKSETAASSESAPPEMPEADFQFFLTTFGMQAWIALGMIPNPMTQKHEENLDQAKFIIDTLGVLEEKTKGNLDEDEKATLEQLLYELRLAYVNKTSGNSSKSTIIT